MAKRYGWTKRILANFIEAQTYEKYLLNQTNFDLTLPEERRVQAKLVVKDEYTFDFAELSPEYSEHELEMQLVNNIRALLFNKKNIKTDVSADALVGNYIEYVTERIKEAGFTNYEAVPVKDIYEESDKKSER